MNSCLYACHVMHDRLEPIRNKFHYKLFMFYLDLDELDDVGRRFWPISHNRPNIFNFRDADHLQFGGKSTKENILIYLRQNGIELPGGSIRLLTHLRMLGHVFNPISIYFCFNAAGEPVCAIPEVGNTYREMKPYLLTAAQKSGDLFQAVIPKYFYVSPYISHDASFEFKLSVPEDHLSLIINDIQEGRRFFLSSLTGERQPLASSTLLGYVLRFPWITLQILGLIHWQAIKLWFRRLPHFRKADYPELQRGYQHVPHR